MAAYEIAACSAKIMAHVSKHWHDCLGVAITALFALLAHPIPLWVGGVIALGALMNGTLEEVFWRGTVLLDDATPAQQIGQLGLFTGWHVALLFATGVVVTGGAAGVLGGAAIGGALWTLARVQTGSIGFGAICHVALNLVAFTELATHNL
ncbi:CPBP family glutamic-type intramembrane protease [Yoonia sp. GPGPB17]|uniref:CPBP family glutamic-type intramembrane protease n=1 Tax=Yoonia sp. GPGPB17 TaxID=3026147 RepID=UPI0030BA5124